MISDQSASALRRVRRRPTISITSGFPIAVFSTPEEGLKALQAGAIDAFVYDKPLLTWIVLRDFSSTLRVLEVTFDSQNYAIALPKGSSLREMLNAALLEATESDWWQQTLFEYLGKTEPSHRASG